MMTPFAIFSMMYVPSLLMESSDAGTLASNIIVSENLIRASIISWIICQMIFIFLLAALYDLLKPVNKNTALLMLALALSGVPIACLNELNRYAALSLLSDNDYLKMVNIKNLHAQAMLFFKLHAAGLNIAQIFWGLWLFPFGYLVFKSGFLPKLLGILLMIGCFGYLIDSVSFFLFPNFSISISPITGIGELLLPLWLLIKGVNVKQWRKRALQSANHHDDLLNT